MNIERRYGVELRAAGRRLEGYAAVFGQETRIADFVELVAPGAFARSLGAGGDLLALVDHDITKVLARTRAGTLKLAEDSRGLHFETVELPNTTAANDPSSSWVSCSSPAFPKASRRTRPSRSSLTHRSPTGSQSYAARHP
jgi:phage head maturation protease